MRLGPFNFNLRNIFRSPSVSGKELGQTGTTIFGGFITGEDYVTELTGLSAVDTYNKMRRSDGVVKAALLACELPIRAARWYVEPASDEKADKDVAEFVSQSLFERMTITWDDFLRQALLMLPFGYSVFEKVFQSVEFEGKEMIGWRKFAPRLQSTILKWETESGKDGVTQQLPTGGTVSIPIEKLLTFTHRKEGDNWVGISILRNAYRSWYFKEHIEKINAIAFERQGLGIPSITLPKGYTAQDRALAETLLKNIRANEQGYMILPDGWVFEFKDVKGNSVKDPNETIKRYNREILGSVLAQFLDLGSSATGSRALSADHSAIFHNNLTAIARQVADGINKYAVKQLVDLNYTVKEYPKLKFSKIGVVPFEKIAKALGTLVQQKIINPDPVLEDDIRILLGLPEKPKEDEGKEKKPVKQPKEKDLKEKKTSELIGWRALTFAEEKINLVDIQSKMDKFENGMRKELSKTLKLSGDDLIRQTQAVLEADEGKEKTSLLRGMKVSNQQEYRDTVLGTTKETFAYGKMIAANEMKKAPPPTPSAASKNMWRSADNLKNVMSNDLMKAAKLALLGGLQQGMSNRQILSNVMKAVRREVGETEFNVPAIAVNGAINQGRRVTFDVYKNDIYALQRSEILDSVTCNFCVSIDERVFKKSDNFTHTDGVHSSCRGIWVEILKDEKEKPSIGGIPQSLRDKFENINVFKPPKNPIIKKDSAAAEFIRKRKSKLSEETTEKQVESLLKLREKINKAIEDDG